MSKLTKLEISVLREFCENFPEYFDKSFDFDTVENSERSFSGKGFMTELPTIPEFQTATHIDRLVWDKATATINGSILVGFLVFLEDGHLSAVEGFTFGESWPEMIMNFEINKD
ncbi:MAG: hypothetical protein KUG74_13290 [Rhodobacteraceae bacterium]|nr:hypothetical protein [Paracoccaceae bacterium]